jgi:ATP-dependent Clp protease ATP-binding subunit ClpA
MGESKMKISASIEIIWQLAGQETIAGEFKEIEPEHLFMALLKFADLPVQEVDNIAPASEAAKQLAVEVGRVREELANRAIDSTKIRRSLRAQMGKGGNPYEGGQIHRSPASRALFDAATKWADDAGVETLTAEHLLAAIFASPTAAIVQILGEKIKPMMPKTSKTPLLDEYGQDLTHLAAIGKLKESSARRVEAKVLGQALSRTNCRCVFLITDSDDAALSVVAATSFLIVSKNCPPLIKGNRIVDITAIKSVPGSLEKHMSQLEQIMAEAAAEKKVILFVPPIEILEDSSKINIWLNLLRATLDKGLVQGICRAGPQAYRKWIEKDSSLRRLAEFIWIRAEEKGGIPTEI